MMAGGEGGICEVDGGWWGFICYRPADDGNSARQFLQATSWKLEEAIQLFYVGHEVGAAAPSPYFPPPENDGLLPGQSLGVPENHGGSESAREIDGNEVLHLYQLKGMFYMTLRRAMGMLLDHCLGQMGKHGPIQEHSPAFSNYYWDQHVVPY